MRIEWVSLLLACAPVFVMAQEPEVDRGVVDACFAAAPRGAVDPDCIGKAAEMCQLATPDGQTTLGISFCLMAEHDAWDAILNREYQAARAQFSRTPGLGEQLLSAQRVWITLRDADCKLAYDRWEGGSMRNIASASCRLEHTARRALELRNMQEP